MTDHTQAPPRPVFKTAARAMLDPRMPSRSGIRTVTCFAAMFAVFLAIAVAGRLTQIEALELIGSYGVIFFGVGAAPFQLRSDLDLYARLTGAVLVGFSLLLGVGALMADLPGLWQPIPAAVVLGAAAVLLHLIGLRRAQLGWAAVNRASAGARGGSARPGTSTRGRRPAKGKASTNGKAWAHAKATANARAAANSRAAASAGAKGTAPANRRGSLDHTRTLSAPLRDSTVRASLLITALGTACWLAPALWTHDPTPGFWGMLKPIGPLWYLGLVLVLAGFALGRRTELSAAISAVSFGLATTLTPALVYGTPREQTAGKQMLLTQYVLTHHHIHVTAGIYQAYSTLFAGIAWMSQLLGIGGMVGHSSLLGIATYWPVLLVFMRIAELRLLTGRLLATTGRRWCAVMLVLLVDSLGADYFSPQAVGYVLAVGAVAISVNGLTPRPFSRRTTIILLTLVGVVLGPTHELSPFMAAGALVVLWMFGQAPFWTCLPIGLPALAWVGVVHKAVGQNFTFGALFNFANFRPPVTVSTPGLQRLPLVGYQSHTLLLALLILIGLGALGFFANFRSKRVWGYAICPIVGLGFIAINPYGNEGIFRATLFAIPWMAVLAMLMPQPGAVLGVFRRRGVMTATVGLCLLVLLGTFVIAAYAMDGTSVLPPSDLKVSAYIARQPPRNAFVLSVGSADNPADGVQFAQNYTTLEWSQVATVKELQALHPTSIDPVALADQYGLIANRYGASRSSPLYLIWARSVMMYAEAYGLQSPQQMRTWLRLLKASPQWRLVDRSGDTYLFRLRY